LHAYHSAPSKSKLVFNDQTGDIDLFSHFACVRHKDDEILASNITDNGLQFHKPDATPITAARLPVVLQTFTVIGSRVE
jgi:hypothetical protein